MDDSQKKDKDVFLPGSIIVAALLIAGALIYTTGSEAVNPPLAKVLPADQNLADDDVVLGDPAAPVTVVEFGDYQCPFCGRFFQQVEPQLREEYIKTGKVKMIYRDFAFLGPESQGAAMASQCAADQGQFWAYHDELYIAEIADGVEHNGNLSAAFFKSIASKLGLDAAVFDACMTSNKHRAEVEKDYNDGVDVGVQGTPTAFVNGKLLSGAVTYDIFKAEIEAALRSVR